MNATPDLDRSMNHHTSVDNLVLPEGRSAANLSEDGTEKVDVSSSSFPTSGTTIEGGKVSGEGESAKHDYVPQFHFSGSKAGMEAVDKSKLEKIIAEISKGNPYYERAAEADRRVLEKAKALKERANKLTATELSASKVIVNSRTAFLEAAARKLLCQTLVCIDMDQFFVAVEVRDNPALKGLPLAVGTTLISTASYEARKYGVRSAMPTFIGKRLCPQLVTVPGRYDAYSEASKRAQSVFAEYDSEYSMMSLDECFLDIGSKMDGLTLETEAGVSKAKDIVEEIRRKVNIATGGLTCSAGVAPNRMLAKICSERNKPNGSFVIQGQYEGLLEFIRALPVRKIPGIGKASELLLLHAFDVKSVGDLFEKRYVISKCLTPAIIDFYLRVPLCATEVPEKGSNSSSASNGPRVSLHGDRCH